MASRWTWDKARHFRPDGQDKWGDADAISDDLILALDDFRSFIGCPIYVTRGVATEGHTGKSYHYRAQGSCAADMVIPDYKRGPINLVMDAMRFGFKGIGWYPHWKYGVKVCGGLHLDVRPLKWDADETLNYSHSRWIGILGDSGKLEYIPMSMENLILYGRKYGHIEGNLVVEHGQLSGNLNKP